MSHYILSAAQVLENSILTESDSSKDKFNSKYSLDYRKVNVNALCNVKW